MKRRKKISDTTINSEDFLIPYEIKKSIFGFVLLIIGILVGLSVFFYYSSDYTYIQNISLKDFFYLIDPNSDISELAKKVHNPLGLIGAIVANVLINNLFGYFSITLPIVVAYWGIIILFKLNNYRKNFFYSMLFISVGLLLATMLGILSNGSGVFLERKELYGLVGKLLGQLLIKLIGAAGGIMIIVSTIIIISIVILRIDISELLQKLFTKILTIYSNLSLKLKSIFNRRSEKSNQKNENRAKEKPTLKTVIKTGEAKIEIVDNSNGELHQPEIQESEIQPARQKQIEIKVKSGQSTTDKTTEIEPDFYGAGFEPWDESLPFKQPQLDLLDPPTQIQNINQEELTKKAENIKNKLQIFNVKIEEIKITPGPVVTLYEVVPSPDVKINEITRLKDDIALALKAKGLRLIAPMPGRGTIGVEIPNDIPESIIVRNVFSTPKLKDSKYNLPLVIGKTVTGDIFIDDLTDMPHLLIAGSTGSGKSVGINTIIHSLLFNVHPARVKFVIIDPKRIELAAYKRLKQHYLAICPDINETIITTPENAVTVLKSLEAEMDKRYDWLSKLDSRNINEFNEKISKLKIKEKDGVQLHHLPFIVLIVDEFADLMLTAGKKIEDSIARLAQMSRAAGIHLIFATQRPSVNVIGGNIKANFPARIAYKVFTKIDSITILDQTGAEQLLGKGDMIYSKNDNLVRIQNAFITEHEINRVLDFIEKQEGFKSPYILPSVANPREGNQFGNSLGDFDELTREAAEIVVQHKIASVTFLQRKLKIGYARAARIMDDLEQLGIVGPAQSGKNRLVNIDDKLELDELLSSFGL